MTVVPSNATFCACGSPRISDCPRCHGNGLYTEPTRVEAQVSKLLDAEVTYFSDAWVDPWEPTRCWVFPFRHGPALGHYQHGPKVRAYLGMRWPLRIPVRLGRRLGRRVTLNPFA